MRRLWHSRGFNHSDVVRKSLFFGYSYRWLRGLDYNLMPEEIYAPLDRIRRQMLGDGVNIKGWWQPTEADVPLKGWLDTHRDGRYANDSPLIFPGSDAGSQNSPFLPPRL